MCRRLPRRRAFTLIELLIVVAIIAILAAIAIPNFLQAQTRAKVSRVKADIRSVATAVESYGADHNRYPPHIETTTSTEILYPDRYYPLTTPIAYMTTVNYTVDPFVISSITTGPGAAEIYYSWTNIDNFPATHALDPVRSTHRWMMRSRGPDSLNEPNGVRNAFLVNGIAAGPSMLYDPTNGVVSQGDILRTAILTP